MQFTPTDLTEVLIVDPEVHSDERGYFYESFRADKFLEAGLPGDFVQDNHSRSARGTLRGLHAQRRYPQGKLIQVLEGQIFDVAVDIRAESPDFGRWVGVALSADSFRQLWIPPGFAHGFCVTSPEARVFYKCTEIYHPEDEIGLIWNDPEVGIDWPVEDPRLSPKDRQLPSLSELRDQLGGRSQDPSDRHSSSREASS